VLVTVSFGAIASGLGGILQHLPVNVKMHTL
jgi:hypothetical protein